MKLKNKEKNALVAVILTAYFIFLALMAYQTYGRVDAFSAENSSLLSSDSMTELNTYLKGQ